jgi:hypothetical protein
MITKIINTQIALRVSTRVVRAIVDISAERIPRIRMSRFIITVVTSAAVIVGVVDPSACVSVDSPVRLPEIVTWVAWIATCRGIPTCAGIVVYFICAHVIKI